MSKMQTKKNGPGDDKKNYGRDKAEAISKVNKRNAAFKKQCTAYKKANPNAKDCKNMDFINPVMLSETQVQMAAKAKGNLTEAGKKKADKTIRSAYKN